MTYCLIVPDFRGIGGTQFYVLRRIRHLNQRSIKTCIIVGIIDDKIINNESSIISIFENQNLLQFAFDVKRYNRKALLQSFQNWNNNEIGLFESYDPVGSTWGEFLAKELNCKHFIYSLVESPLFKNAQVRPVKDFFTFKLKRNELVGLSSVSLEKLFGYKFEGEQNRFVNIPYDSNELTDISQPQIEHLINKNSFVIGTVSRLEKSYIEELIKESIKFSSAFSNSQFTLIIGGDSEIMDYKSLFQSKYSNKFAKPTNLKILFPGYIKPLGKDFFRSLNVFVGMGTGAVSSISQGCATIVVDPLTNMSSGIFGVETNNFAYTESGIQFSIFDSLKDIFINTKRLELAKTEGYKLYETDFKSDICMKKLDVYISESYDLPNYYWDINSIGLINFIIRFLYRNRNNLVIRLINKIRHRFIG